MQKQALILRVLVQSENDMQGKMLKAQPNCSASQDTSSAPRSEDRAKSAPILPCHTGGCSPGGRAMTFAIDCVSFVTRLCALNWGAFAAVLTASDYILDANLRLIAILISLLGRVDSV